MIHKVLVAVDGSENSVRALDFALEFTERYDAALTIINVSESSAVAGAPSEITGYGADSSMVVVAKDMRKFHEEILDKALAHAKEVKPNVPVASVLREGDPALEIVALATDGDFDALVVGHRGAGKVREIFLGNISERVAHLLNRTVIIVR